MRVWVLLTAICGGLIVSGGTMAAEVTYSDTHGSHCRQLVEHSELSTYTCRCPKGRSLTVFDAGMIGGLTHGSGPEAQKWQPATRITGDGIGKKVEWRSVAGVPYAAIHRVHTPRGSVLVITHLSVAGGCHVGYVDGALPAANARAAAIADASRDRFRCGTDKAETVGRKLYDAD
ncbi:hypothetical protein ACFZ8E_02570 [Methylobacterium sp. HMF5984]|uniref:hypothetical protein n=1 Tax=Methylobacterium sp. HMF5984 TaxID=3367370 RepID=UPI003851C399